MLPTPAHGHMCDRSRSIGEPLCRCRGNEETFLVTSKAVVFPEHACPGTLHGQFRWDWKGRCGATPSAQMLSTAERKRWEAVQENGGYLHRREIGCLRAPN